MPAPLELAKQLLRVLYNDRPRLLRIDDYLHGRHDDPYLPPNANDEYKLLAQRCVSNWMPLLVGTPAQALYVDGFRRGDQQVQLAGANVMSKSPEWMHWQRSRLDARQSAVMRGALGYGHSFALTEKQFPSRVITKGLSALRTSALFEDPANDDVPYAALTVQDWPDLSGDSQTKGTALMWDGEKKYAVTFLGLTDMNAVEIAEVGPHGATECPVTRFAAQVDLEGRTIGVIEPMIALQNRINQTVFDLLVAQTYTSQEVRYATGMAPPLMRDEEGDPILDEHNNPIAVPINHNASRFLFAEDENVKFGNLPAGPLDGLINSIDMSIRHLAAVSQTPPHHLLGQIANLSAEALTAAETALARKIEEFRHAFGESWERVFRLAAQMEGNLDSAADEAGEVLWRDMEQRSLAQAADALGKMREQLGIPAKGLWKMVPRVTQAQLEEWELLSDEEPEKELSSALFRSSGNRTAAVVGPD